jgi:hypothetical protein
MAAGNFIWFGSALEDAFKATVDFDGATMRGVLVTSSWTPNQDTNATWTSLSANEVANGGGYTTHGKLLTQTVARSGHVVTFDFDDQSWTSSTITAKYFVVVVDADVNGALASTDHLIGYLDLNSGGGSVSTTNGTFSVTVNASGALRVTAATS